jgi:hypothetical protein
MSLLFFENQRNGLLRAKGVVDIPEVERDALEE